MGEMRILLKNKMPLGDTLAVTGAVRDLKRTRPDWLLSVDTNHAAIWANNPHVCPWSPAPDDDALTLWVGPRIATQSSASRGAHHCESVRICLEHKLRMEIPQGPRRPELWLSDEERARRPPGVDGPYWIVCTDAGPMRAKRWTADRWQAVVDMTPAIRWVRIGTRQRREGELTGDNVVDLTGQTGDLRLLFAWMANAEGFLGLVSGPMHVAAALERPAVILAGAREPETFEEYPFHRYLTHVGALPCAPLRACWRCSPEMCAKDRQRAGMLPRDRPWEEQVSEPAPCMALIEPPDVVRAVNSFYRGGRLAPQSPPGKQVAVNVGAPPLLRIVSNGRMYGGAERSVVEIARMARRDGWRVELATRGGHLTAAMADAMPPDVVRVRAVSAPADVLLLYASDMIWDFDKPEFAVMADLKARRRVMALTYKLGPVGKSADGWWAGWDRYLFLSSGLRAGFAKAHGSDAPATILAPPVDLSEFFACEPDYSSGVWARHSSQGDRKYPESIDEIIRSCPDQTFRLMPPPSWLPDVLPNVRRWRENEIPVAEFLNGAAAFWYLLPPRETEQGPRVVMEAMAAGLPVLTEPREGMADRVTTETGWFLGEHVRAIEVISSVKPKMLAQKGQAARRRAREEFRPERWWEAIRG